MKANTNPRAARYLRTMTICVPAREEDGAAGKSYFFEALVDGRKLLSAVEIERPVLKPRSRTQKKVG